jgi:ABC-2 type transport system ATP-binding protein
MIETFNLTKRFGDLTAVDDLCLRVEPGEVLALLGPNGAGKTTAIRMIASILQPTSGRALILGFDTATQAVEIRRSIGLLTEHHGLYTRMRVAEYLEFFGRIYGLPEEVIDERIEDLLRRYGLHEARELRLGHYSKGMRQKLALVRAMLHDPPILLLDEPTSAMDPSSAHMVRESIRSFRSTRRTIIVCTHNLHEAELLADRIAIIRKGKIIAEGSPAYLKRSLLGSPVWELRVADVLDGAVDVLPADLEPIASGENWLRYHTEQPETDNPRILRAMVEAGLSVVTLAEVERSLEDVYLQVVGRDGVSRIEGE